MPANFHPKGSIAIVIPLAKVTQIFAVATIAVTQTFTVAAIRVTKREATITLESGETDGE